MMTKNAQDRFAVRRYMKLILYDLAKPSILRIWCLRNGLSSHFIYQLEPFALFPQTRNATLLPLNRLNLGWTSHNYLFLLMELI